MRKHFWAIGAVALCVHCAGAAKSSPPQESPGEPTGETESPSADEAAASAAAPAESAAPAAADESKPAPVKKTCASLKKADCQVTQGCAWNSLGKCVDEGASE